ncbi:LysM peptidoglycan-binding domain-containing protein [Trueperella pyogenes]|uniref:LysM peptidoglycan-binding domain-containing protein n=1 Tax=Trueperella pyogenes TaxID=1661 RepID=UPI00345D72D2
MHSKSLLLTGAPSHDLEVLLKLTGTSAIALIAAWYLVSGLALLIAARKGNHSLRRTVARWGPPILRGMAATMLASSFIVPAAAVPKDVDLSWGADLPQSEHVTSPARPTGQDAAPQVSAGQASVEPEQAAPVPMRTYVVRPGDCLWSIAKAHYRADDAACADRVLDLYLANKNLIGDNPNLIHPGQRLRLP